MKEYKFKVKKQREILKRKPTEENKKQVQILEERYKRVKKLIKDKKVQKIRKTVIYKAVVPKRYSSACQNFRIIF